MTNRNKDVYLEEAIRKDDGGWTKHTEYHWQRYINGECLDFWSTTKKYQWQGKVNKGNVFTFIKSQIGK